MEFLRTPDERFENLDGYPFAPNYIDVPDGEGGSLRMHYVDEGPRGGQPVVMVHGNPTWSYMWRSLIPRLADAGYRAIAVDMIGMGRSDKPASMDDYTIARHERWLEAGIIDGLGLNNAHFILHDWGGIVGLRVVANNQDQVASVVYSNTGFPAWEPGKEIVEMNRPGAEFLRAFQDTIRQTEDWPHWEQVAGMVLSDMSDTVKAGFAAPCPDPSYIVANRKFALMLPTQNDNPMLEDNWRALEKLKSFERPFLCLYSDKDVVAPTGYKSVHPFIPGAANYDPVILEGGSHFLLEDIPEAYCEAVLGHLTAHTHSKKR
ncbi:MAG: haloalkane dehalogenase [Hyphomonadaceae bacterium]